MPLRSVSITGCLTSVYWPEHIFRDIERCCKYCYKWALFILCQIFPIISRVLKKIYRPYLIVWLFTLAGSQSTSKPQCRPCMLYCGFMCLESQELKQAILKFFVQVAQKPILIIFSIHNETFQFHLHLHNWQMFLSKVICIALKIPPLPQFMHSLGNELMSLALVTPISTVWSIGSCTFAMFFNKC